MTPTTALKAPERPCKGCTCTIPPQPSGPGRPRDFCNIECRRRYFHRQEQAEINRQRAEADERRWFDRDVRYYGKRKAKRLAKERAEHRAYFDGGR